MVDDETLFRSCRSRPRPGALVMVHAENGDVIDVLVKRALAEGKTEPKWHAATRPPAHRGRGDEPGDPARAHRRLPALHRPRLLRGGDRADRAARARRLAHPGRDLHPVPVHRRDDLDGPGSRARSTSSRRRRARRTTTSASGARSRNGDAVGRSRATMPVPLARQKTLGRDDFSKIPNGGPGIENRLHDAARVRRARRAGCRLNRFVELSRTAAGPALRPVPAQGHDRGRQRRRPGRLGPARSRRRSRPRPTTRTSTTTCSRAARSPGRRSS